MSKGLPAHTYTIREGGRGFRDLWFFEVFDPEGELVCEGGANDPETCVKVAKEKVKELGERCPA